jgi:hypothetical protein
MNRFIFTIPGSIERNILGAGAISPIGIFRAPGSGITFVPPIGPITTTPSGGDQTPTPGTGGSGNVDLQLLLTTVAEDGHVITSEYFNRLRDAIIALAGQLGAGPIGQTFTLTFAPNFFQSGTDPTWVQSVGYVEKPDGGNATGWFPLQLPNGFRIQSMTVIGRKSGTVASFQMHLLRQPINATDTLALIAVPLAGAPDPFQVTTSLQVAGAGPKATEEYSTVDNDNYKYLVEAKLIGADAGATVQIHSIQVTCSR